MRWLSVAPTHLEEATTRLARHPQLAFVAATTGRTNLLAQVLTSDLVALHRYLSTDLGQIPGYHRQRNHAHPQHAQGPPQATRAEPVTVGWVRKRGGACSAPLSSASTVDELIPSGIEPVRRGPDAWRP
ncbi:MAG: Lrp/AsnC ligand binding domain-containing protein [Sciscionella sp.]